MTFQEQVAAFLAEYPGYTQAEAEAFIRETNEEAAEKERDFLEANAEYPGTSPFLSLP